MNGSVSQTILRNTIFTIIARFVHLAATMVTIPVMMHYVGQARYGIWAASFALVDYFTLLDMGFGAATIKYTAQYAAHSNTERIGSIITTALLFYLSLVPLILIPYGFAASVVSFFNIAPEHKADAVFLVKGVLILFMMNQIMSVFRNVLIGIQRFDIHNLFRIGYTFSYMVGTILILSLGWGLRGVVILIAIMRLIIAGGQALWLFIQMPEIGSSIGRFDRDIFKDLFRYGIKLQITSISGLFNFQLDKLLIGRFLTMELVAFYEIGSKIALFVRYIPAMIVAPLVPAASELSAIGDQARLNAMHLRGTKYVVSLSAPIVAYIIAMAPAIMAFWITLDDYTYSVLALRMLAFGYFFSSLTGVVNSIGRGLGALNYEMLASLFIAITNLTLSITFILIWGFMGALLSTTMTLIMGHTLLLYRFNQYIGTSFRKLLIGAFMRPLILSLSAGIVTWLAFYLSFGPPNFQLTTRIELSFFLGGTAILFAMVYMGGLWLSGHFDAEDKSLMLLMINKLRRRP